MASHCVPVVQTVQTPAHQRRTLFGRAISALWAASVPTFDDTLIVDAHTGLPPGGSHQGRDIAETQADLDAIDHALVLWIGAALVVVLSTALLAILP
jgi:hypothetical protein